MDAPPSGDSSSDWIPPVEFDGYRMQGLLGQGGMDAVYLGYDTLLDRPVAIKFIRGTHADAREMFLTEARAAARLQHPNVVSVYRIGEIGRWPYIVSEYIRGQSLDRMPRPVPWKRVLTIGISLARGLAAAHRRGIVHRDLKFENSRRENLRKGF
jgi:serine/threonine protein kinase